MKEKNQTMGKAENQKEFREPQTVCGAKRQGEYTVEDYFGLPDDQVPVTVWGGACRIDFRAVEQQIQFAEE